jgi:hypothetical protein
MDNFRVRKVREQSALKAGTLDSVHREVVQQFRDQSTDVIKQEQSDLKIVIEKLQQSSDVISIVERSKCEQSLRELEGRADSTDQIKEYYMKNLDLMLSYYGGVESITPVVQTSNENTFTKFLSMNSEAGVSRKGLLDEFLQRMKVSSGADVVQLMTEHCHECNVAREELPTEGILVCPRCGSEEYAMIVSDLPSFRDPPKERNNYAYKKINHLNEILNQFQAKESTIIPDEIMNEVILEIRKRRISNVADLNEKDAREILKKLGRSKYYEHAAHILSRLNGNPPPTITPEIEEKIRTMFQEIQAPFLLYCPNDRTNFLSYSYILFKFFELLDLDEYKVYFPLLKSRDRLIAHDQIWKKICDYLKWEFIQSV